MRGRILGLLGDQRLELLARGGQVGIGRQGEAQGHAGLPAVGIGLDHVPGDGQGGGGLAGRQLGADQAQLGARVGIRRGGLLLQIGQRRGLALLAGQAAQFQPVGGGLGLGGADLAQAGDHALGARHVGHTQIDLPQRLKQAQMAGRLAQCGQQRVLGRAPAFLGGQPGDQPQGLGGGVARCGRRLGQIVARQIRLSGPFIGVGHQAQRLGILGVLIQHGAQRQDGVVHPVGLDVPGRFQLERAGMAGILGQHLVDLLAGALGIAVFQKHPGKLHAHVARRVGGFGHAFQYGADLGDRLVALAGLKVIARAQGAEQHRIAALGDDPVHLGPRGIGAALQFDKADQIGMRGRIVGGRGGGQLAQERLGLFGLALGHVEADQIGLGLGVVGKAFDGGAQMRLDGGVVLPFRQQRQPLQIALRVVGLQFQQARGQPVGLVQIARGRRPVQKDRDQQGIVGAFRRQPGGLLGQAGARLGILGLGGVAEPPRQVKDPDLDILGGDLDGAGGVTLELLGLLGVEGHARQRDPHR